MIRSTCIICSHPDLTVIEQQRDYPINASCTKEPQSNDNLHDFTLVGCTKCGCVQVRDLLDPGIIYNTNYVMTTFSKFLSIHDEKFSEFILKNTEAISFLEVGANRGNLYKKLTEKRTLDYTILDLFQHQDIPSHLHFIQGNCEEFDFTVFPTLILSNVFEHLYNPHKFLHCARSSRVKDIFISIPDFDSQLRSKNVNILNRQHIFYCGLNHIFSLFAEYNYKCEAYFNQDNQSCMFKFVFEDEYSSFNFPMSPSILDRFTELFKWYTLRIQKLPTEKNIFICPAGIYGQKLYIYMKHLQFNVYGFLDNDEKKHNSRLVGTDKYVYSPNILNEYPHSNSVVVLCESPYKKEIKEVLSKYTIEIIEM